MAKNTERTLSPREVAQHRGVSLTYVYYQLWTGRIPGARKVGKSWVIPVDAVQGQLLRRGPRNA